MKFAFVIDDPTRVDYVLNELLTDTQDLGDFMGMKAYSGFSQGKEVSFFFYNSIKDSVALRTEDLFLFQDLDVIVNIGYCFTSPHQTRVIPGDNIVVTATKCHNTYKEMLTYEPEEVQKKSFEIDKALEKRLIINAEKLGFELKPIICYSMVSLDEIKEINKEKTSFAIFDEKAFSLYKTAKKHNRNTICLYKARSSEQYDVQYRLTETGDNDSLNNLIKLALEFEFKCRAK